MPTVEITSIPPGAAPDEIRAAWVGLKLKVASSEASPREFEVVSIHTRFDGWLRKLALSLGISKPTTEIWNGFPVEAMPAIWELERAGRSLAALWWCQNTPHILTPGQLFIFPSSCCQVIDENEKSA